MPQEICLFLRLFSGKKMHKNITGRASVLTVGVKILAGVSLASNLFIGALLYVNIQSGNTVEQKVDEVLTIREKLSSNLRAAIVGLQNELLALPELFTINPRAQIAEVVQENFTISERKLLEGRSAYSELYSRKERRDLTKNQTVVQRGDNSISISSGKTDQDGNFNDTVERLTIVSTNPEEDATRLKTLIEKVTAEANSPNALNRKVQKLGAKIADSSLQAESTRNEILQHVEAIRTMESDLQALRQQQRTFTISIGTMTMLANMIVLFVLVRLIVEKPLRKLTRTIEDIRSGKSPEIPYRNRKDQIGVLSGAIANFREALHEIQNENERKAHDKILIEEMFETITSVVNSLETQARELVSTANTLQELATSTEQQSESVTRHAGDTALHINSVSASTIHLQTAFQEIQFQVHDQTNIVAHILESNGHSRKYINDLDESIRSIHTIIGSVDEITDQTKLLALNATIEAARAGAAGKGFGVVASEVKELSHKTEQATNNVMSKIRAIENSSAVLFAHLNSIDDRMQSLNQLTGNITTSVAGQQQVTDTIGQLAGQTSENTQTVSTSILEVRNAAASTRDMAGQVHEFSCEISGQLTRLFQDTTATLEKLAYSGNSQPMALLKN